jgi:hypothetical protein
VTTVKFVCTCRGRHRSQLLGRAFIDAGGAVTFEQGDPENTGARDARGRPRHSGMYAKIDDETGEHYAEYRLVCRWPTCRVHVSWRRARAEAIVRGWVDEAESAGRPVPPFDVSQMS